MSKLVSDFRFSRHVKRRWQDEGEYETEYKPVPCTLAAMGGLVMMMLILGSFFTVSEGSIGVMRTFGEVTGDAKPGLHFKAPLIQSVQHVEVMPRKYSIQLQASTTGTTKDGGVDQVREIVSKYGSIQQFDDRILDPRVKQATLSEVPKYTIEQVMTDRNQLSQNIAAKVRDSLGTFPVTFTDIMVAGIDWHPKIKDAVLNKQKAKLAKEEEQYVLDRQDLAAQQHVNTARANAESITLVAIAEAEAIKVKGLAEATAIKAKGSALKQNPKLVSLVHEERWNGSLITTMLGSDTKILVPIETE